VNLPSSFYPTDVVRDLFYQCVYYRKPNFKPPKQMHRPQMTDDSGNGINRKLRELGEDFGEKLFDALRGDQYSPTIQKQKEPYAEQFGENLISIVMLYIFPIFYFASRTITGMLRPPNAPDSLLYDLIYELPSLPYGLYGSGIIAGGSLLLASDLFDNFFTNDVKSGKVLATIHGGVLYLFIGLSFQTTDFYNIEFSEPYLSNPIFDMAYYIMSHIERILPFVAVPMLVLLVWMYLRYGEIEEDNESIQTQLISRKWR
jgi:hypothetical protein